MGHQRRILLASFILCLYSNGMCNELYSEFQSEEFISSIKDAMEENTDRGANQELQQLLLILYDSLHHNNSSDELSSTEYNFDAINDEEGYFQPGDVLCMVPNDCTFIPGKPYCTKMPTSEPLYKCTSCNPTRTGSICDCYAGQYCVTNREDTGYGSCRAKESDVFKRHCEETLNKHGMRTKLGKNDKSFCGQVIYNNTTKDAVMVEWEGVCQAGVCTECHVSPFTWVPFTAEGCNDGRNCVGNTYHYPLASVVSFEYLNIFPLLAAFYAVIFSGVVAAVFTLLICTAVVLWVFQYRSIGHDYDTGMNLIKRAVNRMVTMWYFVTCNKQVEILDGDTIIQESGTEGAEFWKKVERFDSTLLLIDHDAISAQEVAKFQINCEPSETDRLIDRSSTSLKRKDVAALLHSQGGGEMEDDSSSNSDESVFEDPTAPLVMVVRDRRNSSEKNRDSEGFDQLLDLASC